MNATITRSMSNSIAIVIPILNEAESLPELLHAIKRQSRQPQEIIFVDAGSTDGSPELIAQWWRQEAWENTNCQVLSLPGGLPGGGRNAGIRAAESAWIAFLDGGIEPEADWLEQLYTHAVQHDASGVFGVCAFHAETPFERAVCALSYGYDSVHPVIPASLFQRRVFDEIGFFPDHLRAAEDLFWVRAYLARYGSRQICAHALVHYRHFPSSWRGAIRKWRINERNSVRAGVRYRQHVVYAFAFPLLYGLLLTLPVLGLPLFGAYLVARGVVDPIRRSKRRRWWGQYPSAIFKAVGLAVMLDLAKFVGICQEWFCKLGSGMRK